jgi:hypothetical protein
MFCGVLSPRQVATMGTSTSTSIATPPRTQRTWRAAWPWPTVALPAVVLVALLPHHSALLLVGVLAALCVALAVVATLRGERADSRGQAVRSTT